MQTKHPTVYLEFWNIDLRARKIQSQVHWPRTKLIQVQTKSRILSSNRTRIEQRIGVKCWVKWELKRKNVNYLQSKVKYWADKFTNTAITKLSVRLLKYLGQLSLIKGFFNEDETRFYCLVPINSSFKTNVCW